MYRLTRISISQTYGMQYINVYESSRLEKVEHIAKVFQLKIEEQHVLEGLQKDGWCITKNPKYEVVNAKAIINFKKQDIFKERGGKYER